MNQSILSVCKTFRNKDAPSKGIEIQKWIGKNGECS